MAPLTSAQITTICTTFASTWSAGLAYPLADFLSLYSPTIQWVDHAFQMQRQGHASITGLRQSWLTANENLRADIKAINITNDNQGAVLELSIHGKFVGDLLPRRKATGKSFQYPAAFVFRFDADGLIERVDEYYSMTWDDAVGLEEYVRLTPIVAESTSRI